MKNDHKPPKASAGDVAHAIARAGIGAIPFAGAAATELLYAIVTPPLEKRLNEWRQRVGEGLHKLEEHKGVNLEELQNNDAFIDIAMHATQAALRTSKEKKLEALRNAVLNSALPNPPEESLQQMFVTFIDTLTPWHLKLLELLQDQKRWGKLHNHTFPNSMNMGFAKFIESAFPELRGHGDFYAQIGRDLALRGLTQTEHIHTLGTGSGAREKHTTTLGDKFLRFISNPLAE